MMRLIGARLILPLVLCWLVAATMTAAGQQTQPAPAQKTGQTTAVKQGSGKASHSVATKGTSNHSVAKRSHARAAARKSAKRPEYRPEYADNSVEVINGDSTKKVVFHDEQAEAAAAKNLPAALKNVPAPLKVDVVNGNSTDTQYFYGNGQDEQSEAARNEPVVLAVRSSDTRMVGGNKHPVVTSVTSSSNGNAKSASSGGQPVTKGVSPRPKRPAYAPDAN